MTTLRRRVIRLLRSPGRRRSDRLVAEGNYARDQGRHLDAARSYAASLALAPDRGDIHVQAGHMFKEARDFDAAHGHYTAAQRLLPEDADLALQLGHFYKTVDRPDAARDQYRRAAALAPEWEEAARELAAMDADATAAALPVDEVEGALAWQLLPGPVPAPASGPLDQILLRRLGDRRDNTPQGLFPYLSGVEAIRGVCFSDRPLVGASLLIDDATVHREAIATHEVEGPAPWKAVFNLWVDLSAVPPGIHRLAVVLADASGWTRRHVETVVVGAPASAFDDLFASDALVVRDPSDLRDLEAQIRAAPSAVRPISMLHPPPPERILVARIDQLGDMVVSVPALRRLRALFPDARIVGLLGPANGAFARTLGLFDEVIEVDVPDDPVRRRRTMTPERQRELVARLAPERFDVAIDLAVSNVSRPLLRLSGARLTFGFDDGESPWLDGGISGSLRHRRGGGEASPQSARMLALVERLGTLFGPPAPIVRRADLDPTLLTQLGLTPADRFVVLHAGARIAWSRWPGFVDLARAILARHAVHVVLLTEGTQLAAALPATLRDDHRLVTVDRWLPFDALDTLLSSATAFVGNDSGPKHLAALRGIPVVGIHCARIGWAEWSQEQTGVVVSRQVPCAGCAIFHDPDECGKGIACITDIGVDEVLAALEALLATTE